MSVMVQNDLQKTIGKGQIEGQTIMPCRNNEAKQEEWVLVLFPAPNKKRSEMAVSLLYVSIYIGFSVSNISLCSSIFVSWHIFSKNMTRK